MSEKISEASIFEAIRTGNLAGEFMIIDRRGPDSLQVTTADRSCEATSFDLTRSEVIALRDKLTEWIGDMKCLCCGDGATNFLGSNLQCCAFCYDHCRAPGPIDTNWYHGVIDPTEKGE